MLRAKSSAEHSRGSDRVDTLEGEWQSGSPTVVAVSGTRRTGQDLAAYHSRDAGYAD